MDIFDVVAQARVAYAHRPPEEAEWGVVQLPLWVDGQEMLAEYRSSLEVQYRLQMDLKTGVVHSLGMTREEFISFSTPSRPSMASVMPDVIYYEMKDDILQYFASSIGGWVYNFHTPEDAQ